MNLREYYILDWTVHDLSGPEPSGERCFTSGACCNVLIRLPFVSVPSLKTDLGPRRAQREVQINLLSNDGKRELYSFSCGENTTSYIRIALALKE
jgi:hypothetical protein